MSFTITLCCVVHHHPALCRSPSPCALSFTITLRCVVRHHPALCCSPSPCAVLFAITLRCVVRRHPALCCSPSPCAVLFAVTLRRHPAFEGGGCGATRGGNWEGVKGWRNVMHRRPQKRESKRGEGCDNRWRATFANSSEPWREEAWSGTWHDMVMHGVTCTSLAPTYHVMTVEFYLWHGIASRGIYVV